MAGDSFRAAGAVHAAIGMRRLARRALADEARPADLSGMLYATIKVVQ
jgi:hypothetical protein